MNATKFAVLILIGVVCANVSAIRQPEGVSKETKLGISDPKTATTNGVGDELNVVIVSGASFETYAYASASDGRNRPSGNASASSKGVTSGRVIASGRNVAASSRSTAGGAATSTASANPRGATARGFATGGASTNATGSTGGERP